MSSIDKDWKDYLEEQEELRKSLEAIENDHNLKRKERISRSVSLSLVIGLSAALLVSASWPLIANFYNVYLLSFLATWWVNLLVVPLIGVVGFVLYQFKRKSRKWYGILEVALGLVAGWSAISKVATAGMAEGITLVAAVYFVVRGIDNIYGSIDDLKNARLQKSIEEHPRARFPITYEEVKHALDSPSGAELVRQRYGR